MTEKKPQKPSSRNQGILSNNWLITLSATLIGVFLALYLNEQVAKQKLNEAKASATDNILAEMEGNLKSMQAAVVNHQKVFDVLNFMSYQDSESGKLIVPLDSMMKFRRDYPQLLELKDSIQVEEGIYAYSNGSLDFDFQLPQFELSTLAWNTLVSSGMSRSYNFDCLMQIRRIYQGTDKVISLNQELFDSFYRTQDFRGDRDKILRLLAMLLDFEKTAIQALENGMEEIQNCS